MNTVDLTVIASLMVALSVASERLVEIVKGFCTYLEVKNDDPKKEGRRRAWLHVLSVVAGIVSAYFAWAAIKAVLPGDWWKHHEVIGPLSVGFLAGGGSSFWNSILGYANKLKDVKKLQAQDLQKRLG